MPITSSKMLHSSNLEDVVDYFITAAKMSIENGEFDWAKASLMSASALQPENYLIRYESLKMCKIIGNVKEAAKKFVDLFSPTSLQPVPQTQTRSKKVVDTEKQKQFKILKDLFIEEMKNVLMSIHEEWSEFSKNNLAQCLQFEGNLSSENRAFYKNMFFHLSKDDQINVLTKFSTFFAENHIVTVDLLLYIIEKYSSDNAEMLSDCASRLIEVKQELESKADPQNKELIAYLRKKYVFLILPVLYNSSSVDRDESQLKLYFYDALKYFIEDFVISSTPLSNTVKSEYEHKLIEITHILSKRIWKQTKSFELNLCNLEVSINAISNFVDTFARADDQKGPMNISSASEEGSSDVEQVLFHSLTLFAFCFSNYSSTLQETVLIERLHTGFDQKKSFLPSKKRKLMQQYQPQPKLLASSKKLSDNFNALVKLNKMLSSVKVLDTNFNIFIKHVNLINCINFEQLKADTLLFSGSYLESCKLLETIDKSVSKVVDPLSQPKRCMQQTCCYIRQNELSKAARQLIKLIKLLDLVSLDPTVKAHLTNPPVNPPGKHDSSSSESSSLIAYCDLDAFIELQNSSTTRQLILLPVTLNNVFGFIIDCCICLLKELVDSPLEQDLAIGHLIVLSQFSWPYYFETFSSVMEKLDTRAAASSMSKFVYPFFTNFVFNSDVIETIMGRVDLPNFTFELAPAAPVDPNQPLNLHSTRGASRTYRDDITALIHKQMETSLDEIPVDLFRDFLLFQMQPYLSEMYKLNK